MKCKFEVHRADEHDAGCVCKVGPTSMTWTGGERGKGNLIAFWWKPVKGTQMSEEWTRRPDEMYV